jgi:O-6-methylguanine DNA methyltransferase
MPGPWNKVPKTPFERAVHKVVQSVPKGRVITYRDVAIAVGKPGAARAVGNVMRCNPDTDVTPCHRVVRADGSVGGYNGGYDEAGRKVKRLRAEGVAFESGDRVRDFVAVRWRPK